MYVCLLFSTCSCVIWGRKLFLLSLTLFSAPEALGVFFFSLTISFINQPFFHLGLEHQSDTNALEAHASVESDAFVRKALN